MNIKALPVTCDNIVPVLFATSSLTTSINAYARSSLPQIFNPFNRKMLGILPDEATWTLAALLDSADLECLRGVCRETAHDPLLRDPRPHTLVLPPTEAEAARLLLASSTDGTDSSQFGRQCAIAAVQVANAWHVDLLLASPLCALVKSVRLKPVDNSDNETTRAICEKLQQLPSLTRLETTTSSLHFIDTLAGITQLRELDLTGTKISTISSLSSLVNLQKLVLDAANISDVRCVRYMTQLLELRILDRSISNNREGRYVKAHVPPLHAHTKLQRLELESCSIESTADLFGIARGLHTLKLTKVRARQRNTILDDVTRFQVNVDEPELLTRLAQLEHVRLIDSVSVMGVTDEGSVDSLAKISSLKSIQHPIESNLAGLAPLIRLEELELHLCTTYMDRGRELEDFSVLLQLPLLKKLKIKHNGHVSWPMPVYIPSHEYENIKREARAFTDVLEQLTGLETLHYEGFIDSDDVLPQLTQLKELTLSRITPQIKSFDWIRQLQCLCSLTVTTNTSKCDLAGIGYLTQLEALSLRDVQLYCEDHSAFSFLSMLMNLRKLELQGDHIHNLAGLAHLKRLQALTLKSTCKQVNMLSVDSLLGLQLLRELDISDALFDDVTPLLALRSLRSASIADTADCTPLVGSDHPKLLYLSHRGSNCMWSGPHPASTDVQYDASPYEYSSPYSQEINPW